MSDDNHRRDDDDPRPRTPAEALDRLRHTDNTLVSQHVKLFAELTLQDRCEFLFRTALTQTFQLHAALDAIAELHKRLMALEANGAPAATSPASQSNPNKGSIQ